MSSFISFVQLLISILLFSYRVKCQLTDGLSLSNEPNYFKWFTLQSSTPYVRKFVFNDEILKNLQDNNKTLVDVLEAQYIVQNSDPKEDLMISVNGSQFNGRKPIVILYNDMDEEGILCGEGSTICFISQNTLKVKQRIFLKVQCADNCEFEVLVHYQMSKERLSSQKSLITMNDKEYIKKLGFMIEQDRLLIKGFLIKVIIPSKFKGSFDMYLFQGKAFKSTSDALETTFTTSNYGKIIKIESEEGFKTLSDFSLVLRSDSKQQFMINVSFLYFEDEIGINLNTPFSYVLRANESIVLRGLEDYEYYQSLQKNFVNIDIDVHEGSGFFFVDEQPYIDTELYRIKEVVSNFQTVALDKIFFSNSIDEKPRFYIKITAIRSISFTIDHQMIDLKQRQRIDVNDQQYAAFQKSESLKYILFDLTYQLGKQLQVFVTVEDLTKKYDYLIDSIDSAPAIRMVVKNCEGSIKEKQKCRLTSDEIFNQSRNNDSIEYLPVINSDDGYSLHCTLNQFPYQNKPYQKKSYSYSIAIIPLLNNTMTIFKLQTKLEQKQERIYPFSNYNQEIQNFQRKFFYVRLKNPLTEPQLKRVTIYLQTQYGSVDMQTSLLDIFQTNANLSSYSSYPRSGGGRFQKVSATSSLMGETYVMYDLDLNGGDQKEIYISVLGRSQSVFSLLVYAQNAFAPTLGHLRAIGDNLDQGRVYDGKLSDLSTMNTLNLFLPENTSNIFIYFYLDYSDVNMERVKRDIKMMTQNKQRQKKKVKVSPQIKLTDLQTGKVQDPSQYKAQEINDGLLYIETKNKERQYYQLDILNDYSTAYNISIYYSILYSKNNYYFLKSGFKYYFTLNEETNQQIVFFYARVNTTVYFQIFSCNGTFSFQQYFEKPGPQKSIINYTINSHQDFNVFIEKSDFYYFTFDLVKPETKGEIIFNLHMYDYDEYSPYDLIQTPSTTYDVKQDAETLNIQFNYLTLNSNIVENLEEQIFQPSYPTIKPKEKEITQQLFQLDLENTKALKKVLHDISTVKISYFFQISSNQSLVSYCNPCFTKERTYKGFYILEKRSFASQTDQINKFTLNKKDIFNQIQKYGPQQIQQISASEQNSTLSTELSFSIMAMLEIKDNLGQLTEQYIYVYEKQQITVTYLNTTQVIENQKQSKVMQSQQYTIIICTVIFSVLLLIGLICSFRIFRKDMRLPCSCFMQQVYSDIPDSDHQIPEVKIRRLSNKAHLEGEFNQQVRESIQEFIEQKKRKKKLSPATAPPPPTLDK